MKNSICKGLNCDEFHDLTNAQRKKIVKLLARVSEKSYRRGAQQSQNVPWVHDSQSKWRYSNIDKSIGINKKFGIKTVDRLFVQYPELNKTAFHQWL